MTLGKNLIVSIDGVPVAGAKSCQFQISQNFINVCSPTASRVLNKKPTTYDWSVSVDCLIPSSTLSVSLVDKLIAGTSVLLTFTDGSGQNRAGFAYVKSCDESGPVGSLAKFSASFESDGELCKYIGYSADKFSEGNRVTMLISNSTPAFIFNSLLKNDLYGVEITPSNAGKLYLIGVTNDWVVYNDTFANIKSNLVHEQTPSSTVTGLGEEDGSITLSNNQTYTFLSNASPKILFLYA